MKPKIESLRKRLVAIKAEATAIVDAADKDSAGKLSSEQITKIDALMTEREETEANIKRLEQIDSMSVGTGRATTPAAPARAEASVSSFGNATPAIESDPMRGFRSAAEFGRAVQAAGKHGGHVDERLLAISREESGGVVAAPSGYMTEGGSSDGYMVPPQVSSEVSKLVLGDEGLIARFAPEPTVSNSVEELVDASTPWGTTGVLAYWSAEGGLMTSSRPVQTMVRTNLHKLYALVTASDELLEDAPRLQQRLTVGAADAIRWKAEEALINGDGVGKPLGAHIGGSLISQAKESNQVADTVVAANVLKMRSRLLGDGTGAFWLAHSSTIPQLAVMTIGDQPMWLGPRGTLHEAPGGMLLGLPVVISEHAQVVGDAGDIQLIQPKGYMSFVKSSGIQFAMSMHLYFDYGVNAFRWTFRLGGQPKLNAAITQAKGSATLSHFIDTAARA